MHFRFLLGPAGSGKTSRCLAEIRETLKREPNGAPLLLLAPKQSTYQLERQLLEDPDLPGWTRLQILSFERLARGILEESQPVRLLDEAGRIMVLRALLRREAGALELFRSSSRQAGFAQELSATLRELQRHRIGPARLRELAGRFTDASALGDKLTDLDRLLGAYQDWLSAHELEDADLLPDLATEALADRAYPFQVAGLWLDGFAELTPQETALLAAVARRSGHATLAFCCPDDFQREVSWLSTWTLVTQTVRRVHTELTSTAGAEWSVETLRRTPEVGRFVQQPALAHLEQAWTSPAAATGPAQARAAEGLRLVECVDFEHEAEIAAREIWRHVRAGGRFRDIAVTLRSLDFGHAALERVFLRYEIPYFLDRREPLAHHPLAELTRGALRLAAFHWQSEDWFGVLKTGLAGADAGFVDALENEALARGWEGAVWSQAHLESPPGLTLPPAVLREVVVPFTTFLRAVGEEPSAAQLVAALRRLWESLRVEDRLRRWAEEPPDPALRVVGSDLAHTLHRTAREQIDACLGSLELGFAETQLPLRDWLPILDAGLAAVTAGVIPPSQDQVMIGAVDRSRQPDLQLALVLGLNEGRFPAPALEPGILTEADRRMLDLAGASLGTDRRRRIGHERYYAYIAFTRPRRRLVLTWSRRDREGRPLNPSPFLRTVQEIFPELPVERAESESVSPSCPPTVLAERAEHPCELVPWLLARPTSTPLDGLAGDPVRRAWLRQSRVQPSATRLHPSAAALLYGREPHVSLSALEDFAACPFRFFAKHGLRGRERRLHEVDPRETGSLAHELLARFHTSVTQDGGRWRDLSPDQARRRFDQVAARTVASFHDGLFHASPEARWQVSGLLAALRDFVGTTVGWLATNRFDPTLAEVGFGGSGSWPAWRLVLTEGRALHIHGKVDRVDCLRTPEGQLQFLVLDYKLSLPRVDDDLITAGIDLQLVTYLLALTDLRPWPAPAASSFASPTNPSAIPVGLFYVGIRSRPKAASSRAEWISGAGQAQPPAPHRGRFLEEVAPCLDPATNGRSTGQFQIRYTKAGRLAKTSDGRTAEDFDALLSTTHARLRQLGSDLIGGLVGAEPLKLGTFTACDECDLQALCRFDAWTQSFRRLE